ncbi:MAG: hypothetical protein ACP5R5_07500 [Armatimonadota bacterium]
MLLLSSIGKGSRYAAVAAAAALAVLLAGCGGGGGGGGTTADVTPPMVRVSTYTRLLPATGGTASIDAVADDNVGIDRVEVRITTPDGNTVTLVAAATGRGVYTASFVAPANLGTTAMVYKFKIYATDTSGNTAFDGEYSFQVASPDSPPPPPPFSI